MLTVSVGWKSCRRPAWHTGLGNHVHQHLLDLDAVAMIISGWPPWTPLI
jgi:hypothetical protein